MIHKSHVTHFKIFKICSLQSSSYSCAIVGLFE